MSSATSALRRLLNRKLFLRLAQLEAATTAHARVQQVHAAVLERMAEGLYVVDSEGRLLMMNAAASRLLGWTDEDLLGQPVHDLVHHQRANGTPLPVEECELTNAYRRGEAINAHDDVFTHKDGSIVPVSCSLSPLVDPDGPRGAVVVFRERSERDWAKPDSDARLWARRIREALDEDRLELFAQPIVPLDGGEPREELLLRMIDRDGTVIAPRDFLVIAERYGLIGEIDRWVVRSAIRHAARGKRVDVNLSASSVGDPELLAMIERELHDSDADPADVVFEITETALIHDIDAGEAFARSLNELGCRLALDDFGTGFASFTYLKRLPLSYLKIDIEFVRQLGSTDANQHLVRAIVNLAQGFGHETIAEGVEDEETLLLLRYYGVDYAQGFHLGRPAPVEGGRRPVTTAS